MAKVYYKIDYVMEIDRYCFILSNSNEFSDKEEFVFNKDNPLTKDQIIWIDVVDSDFIFPEDASGLFYGATNEIFNGMDRWDTSACTNMSYLFAECHNLKNSGYYQDPEFFPGAIQYYFSALGWDVSNVTDMSHMFENCVSMEEFIFNMWDTSKVTDMSYMFSRMNYSQEDITPITSIDVSDWDTSNVTNMSHMFEYLKCDPESFLELRMNNWDTSKVTDFSYMFMAMNFNFSISNFSTIKATSLNSMLSGTRLPFYDISHFDTSGADCAYMFRHCALATEINIGEMDLSSTTIVEDMFEHCQNVERIIATPGTDWSIYPESQFTTTDNVFIGCDSLLNWDGNTDLSKANNTKSDGYFTVGTKNWKKFVDHLKMMLSDIL